ncbi:7853_t:CDS:2, partial [Dentiscutata heterogama]
KFNNQFINNKPPEAKFNNQFFNNKPPEAKFNNQLFNNKPPEAKFNNQFINNKPPETKINNQFFNNKPPETKINNQFINNKTIYNQPKYNTTKHKYSSFTINYTINSPINRDTIKNTFQIPERTTLEELLSCINKQVTNSSFNNISEGIPRKFYYENNFNQKIMIVDEEDWRIAKWERKKSGNTEFSIKFC